MVLRGADFYSGWLSLPPFRLQMLPSQPVECCELSVIHQPKPLFWMLWAQHAIHPANDDGDFMCRQTKICQFGVKLANKVIL